MPEHHRMIRVLTLPERNDAWLVRIKDAVSMDIPGGRVTLALDGGWSESGIAYTKLTYEPLRAGLVQFGNGPASARPMLAASRGMSTPDSSRVSAENHRAPDGEEKRVG